MDNLANEITLGYLQDVRSQVRQTASLLSTRDKISECMSGNWAADLHTRTIHWRGDAPYAPGTRLTDEDILFLVSHEAGHLMHSGDYSVRVPQGRSQDFHLFANAAEDIRMEKLLTNEFPGFKPVQEPVYRRAMPMHQQIQDYTYSFQFGLYKLAEWANCLDAMPAVSREVLDLVAKYGKQYDEAISRSKSTQELATNVLPIYKKILQKQIDDNYGDRGEDQPGQGQGQDAQGGQQGQGQEGQGQSGQGQPGDGQPGQGQPGSFADAAKGKGQEQKGQGAGSGQKSQKAPDVDSMPQETTQGNPGGDPQYNTNDPLSKQSGLNSIQENMNETTEALPGGGIGLQKKEEKLYQSYKKLQDAVSSEYHKQQQTAAQQETLKEVEHNTERRSHTEAVNGTFDAANKYGSTANALAHQLKTKLVNNSADYWDNSKKRGRLNPRHAHRVERGDYRIFRTRTQIGTIDYVVGMLVDTSGSMKEYGMAVKAAEVTTLLVDALEKAGIPHFVIPYASNVGTKSCLLIGDKRARYGDALIGNILHPAGGTFEGAALDAARAEFAKIQDSKKILFCLTDGATASIPTSVELIEKLQKSGVICIGVGLNMNPPDHFPKGIRVDNGADLVIDLPRLLNQLIRTGH